MKSELDTQTLFCGRSFHVFGGLDSNVISVGAN